VAKIFHRNNLLILERMVGGQTRSDFTRDPCPWRLVEDMGGAYSLGLTGGTVFHGGKSLFRVHIINI
jgi:hypothetical protein